MSNIPLEMNKNGDDCRKIQHFLLSHSAMMTLTPFPIPTTHHARENDKSQLATDL